MHDRWGCMRWRHASVRVHGTRSFRWGSVTAGPTARTLALREDGGGDVQSGFKGRGGFVVAMLCSGVGGLQGHQLRPCRGHLCLPLMDSSLRLSSLTLQLFANFKNSSPTTTPDASCDAQHWSVVAALRRATGKEPENISNLNSVRTDVCGMLPFMSRRKGYTAMHYANPEGNGPHHSEERERRGRPRQPQPQQQQPQPAAIRVLIRFSILTWPLQCVGC